MVSTAVDPSAVASVVGIKSEFKNLSGGRIVILPKRIVVLAQGNTASQGSYSTDKFQVLSALQAAEKYGYGSPIHLAVKQLLPLNGDGVGTIPVTIYPLEDAPASVAASGSITAAGTQTETAAYEVKINEISSAPFVIQKGEEGTAIEDKITEAINAILDMPMTAVSDNVGNKSDLTAKWKGESSNDLKVEIVGPSKGITFTIVQPAGGLVNPNINSALAQMGNVWETFILNCLNISDTDTLDKTQSVGDGRYGALVKKPFISFVGNNKKSVTDATVESDARKTDKINSQLVAPASKELPFVIAARQLARIAKVANTNPAKSYQSQKATGLVPGKDGEQWDYISRDAAVKKGSSTIEVKDGVIELSDIVTFYHPSGDPRPAYRNVVSIIKTMEVIFNTELIFADPSWAGAPLIPDNQATTNPDAKKPSMAKAAISAMIDSLALAGIISDPDFAKKSIVAVINEQNPDRLDVSFTVKISGNTNIISVDFNWGFYFGSAPAAA